MGSSAAMTRNEPIPQGWPSHAELHKEMRLCDKMIERSGLLVRTDWAGRFNAASSVHGRLAHRTHSDEGGHYSGDIR